MRKIFCFLFLATILNGCAESVAILGPSLGTGGGVARSSLTTAVNYGIKKQTGKTPMQHALTYNQKAKEAKDSTISDLSNLRKSISNLSKVKNLN